MRKELMLKYLYELWKNDEGSIRSVEKEISKLVKDLERLKADGYIEYGIKLDNNNGMPTYSNLNSAKLTPKGEKFVTENEEYIEKHLL